MTLVCVLLLLVSIGLVGFGAWYAYQWSSSNGVILLAIGLFMLLWSVLMTVYHIDTEIRVDTLLDTGKYEIVTNEDYSLKELEQFMNVGGVYFKEVEE